ncbi:uncharacterized protein [Typha angustifolia]|uniref:uncharacterized protein isoform X2 n=1 Tax=Typha angustifolia TaxID=59011 RepID=UPI003C2C54C2
MGNLQHVYAGSNCIELKGHDIMNELILLLRYLNLCMYFSKKRFPVFLEFGGYSKDDVLLQKSKARLLKPSFTIVCDRSSKCFLLFIRGAISFKDRLTAATSAEVPFHHIILHEGKVSNLVLGYAHCGMVAAARWIAKCSIPCLDKAVSQFPEYKIKIIGHSMGAGIAAILTYILRECDKFSSCTCVAFGPAACMTWELAESGKEFITSLVNKTDLVPTFSKVSADNLRSEVKVSPWLSDLRDQIQQTRFLNIVNHSVTFVRSHIPFISSSRCKVIDADIVAPHVSSNSEAVLKQKEDVTESSKSGPSCCSCIGACHRASSATNANPDLSGPTITSDRMIKDVEVDKVNCEAAKPELVSACSMVSDHRELDKEDGELPHDGHVCSSISAEEMGEYTLLVGLENDFHQHEEGKEAAIRKEPGEEDALSLKESSENDQKNHQLYPPGRIIHMVALPATAPDANSGEDATANEILGIYETPRELYGKIRLARNMIREHYMPKYIQMIELLVDKLGKDDGGCNV